MTQHNNRQSGNVLFIIFIAILLLAALSFAVTSSSRTGNNISEQQADLYAAEIINFSGKVSRAVNQLMLRGCSVEQISFHHDTDGDGVYGTGAPDNYYLNPFTPGYECYVFHPDGGNIEYQDPPHAALMPESAFTDGHGWGTYVFTGGLSFYRVGEMCTGTTCTDLAIGMKWMAKETCEAINRKIYKRSDIPIHESWAWAPNYTHEGRFYRGTFTAWNATTTLAHPATSFLSGNPMGCFKIWLKTPDHYMFYSILAAR